MKANISSIVNNRANVPRNRLLLMSLPVVLIVCVSSCIVIPTPSFDSGNARDNIKKETPFQFDLGKTTRADIILVLGEPDAVSPDELMLVYRSEKIRGIYFVGGAGYTGAAGAIMKDLYLVAEFDAHGLLQRLKTSSQWLSSADPNEMLPAATTNENWAIKIKKSAYWLNGIDGFKPRGSTEMIGSRGQLLLTDKDLQFVVDVPKAQFANIPKTSPDLAVPFNDIAEVNVDKWGLGRRLVVRTSSGEVHSFNITKGLLLILTDKEATQSIAEFVQSKIQH
ncbi:MAG: hypothetical protein JXB18_14325 [Sedimentisphaerales bacterium]|nr:hypothetical protein [Sedimentisphaerales bacterium]